MTSQLPSFLEEVNSGWHGILNRLHSRLLDVDPNYKIGQVKEKYGILTIYIDFVYDSYEDSSESHLTAQTNKYRRMEELIMAAEKESAVTCEFCGSPGSVKKTSSGWWKATCEPCRS